MYKWSDLVDALPQYRDQLKMVEPVFPDKEFDSLYMCLHANINFFRTSQGPLYWGELANLLKNGVLPDENVIPHAPVNSSCDN